MVTFQMLKTRKLEKAKIFQLCTVIFPTMIMEVQIIKIFPLYEQSVKVSAFHLQWFGNGKIWYERYEKKCKKLNLFQLCSVIFPTMIIEVQIFDVTHYP